MTAIVEREEVSDLAAQAGWQHRDADRSDYYLRRPERVHIIWQGSHAISGVMAIRPAVNAFGRFTSCGERLGERFEHEFADGAQRLEHAVARDGDCFKIRRALDPFPGRKLLDQIFPGVIRVRRNPLAARLGEFPAGVERGL